MTSKISHRPATVAERLVLLRGWAEGLSAREAGRLAGLSEATVRKLEKGESKVLVPTVEDLAALYGVSVGWLAAGEGVAPDRAAVAASVAAARASGPLGA